MRLIKFSFVLFSFLWLNNSFAMIHPLTSCQQLRAPNTVLLVHASWCPHCKNFLPVYRAVSNLPSMKDYTFYVKRNDRMGPVCNTAITGVPTVFTHNMSSKVSGEVTRGALIGFIES